MSLVRECKCGWKLPLFVAKLDREGIPPHIEAAIKTCKLETILVCPVCRHVFGRKERFGDLDHNRDQLAKFIATGDKPS
jgi:hypothetical protein